MSEEQKWVQRLPRKSWKDPVHEYKPVAPMPPNTLTNADGTPYQAGYDETAQEKLQKALAIMEEKAEFHSDLHGEQLERACKLVREALQLI